MTSAVSVSEDITAPLRAEILSIDAELEAWVNRRKADMSALSTAHDSEMATFVAEKQALEGRRKELEERQKQVAQLRQQQAAELEALSQDIEQLRKATAPLPEKMAQLAVLEESRRAKLEALREELTSRAQLLETEHNELTRGVLLYKRLGLHFERAHDDRLRLIFTQLDPQEPQRPFSFCVHIDDLNVYHISGCIPALPAHVVDPMLNRLNQDNNFGAFVCGMRRHFRALV